MDLWRCVGEGIGFPTGIDELNHIIWDWNGTLIDDAGLCVRVLNELLADWGRGPVSVQAYRDEFGFPVRDYYERIGFPLDREDFESVSQRFIARYYELFAEVRAHFGVVDLIENLRAKGVTHSILSASKQDHLEAAVRTFDLDGHFERLVGIGNIFASGKLAEGKRWVSEMPWDPRTVLLVGDTLHDFEVAEALGVPVVLLAHGHHAPERLRQTGAPVVETPGSLRAFIERHYSCP